MQDQINLSSARARKARLARRIGSFGYKLTFTIGLLLLAGFIALYAGKDIHYAYLSLAVALICLIFSLWYKRDLSNIPTKDGDLTDRLSADVLSRLSQKTAPTH
ncbi:MAG: hypothetical protein WDN66_01620 [Candidatus Saccharibacteria bacterium]